MNPGRKDALGYAFRRRRVRAFLAMLLLPEGYTMRSGPSLWGFQKNNLR